MRTPPTRFISALPRRAGGRAFRSLPFSLTIALLLPAAAFPQGFGTIKTDKVVLHRKLPAVIHLSATSISVKTTSHQAQPGDTAQLLTEFLQTNLLKYDKTLTIDDTSPNIKIQCTITNFEIPAPQQYTKDDTIFVKGKPTVKKMTFYHVSGTLDADVRVTDRGGKTLDSNSFSAKYAQEYEMPDAQTGSVGVGAVVGALHSMKNKVKPGDEPAPTNAVELEQQLVRKMVALITPRLVNTDEPVEIPLAKGKLDDANKLADGGLWSRDLETLETMTPLPNPQDDAYRFYDIGVANEALGYQAEDHTAAKNFLMEAAINYGKAIDAKPTEKNFIEAQNRIEVAVTYYKNLSAPAPKAVVAESAPPAAEAPISTKPAAPAAAPAPGKTAKPVGPKSTSTKPPTAPTTASTPPRTAPAKPAAPALTNAKVIEMFKGGVDEPTIIAAIHDAHSTQFDLSADGLIDLAKNGVKGKIVEAMRTRVHAAGASHISNGGE